jgi:putative chitinase
MKITEIILEYKNSPLEEYGGLAFRIVADNGQLMVNAFDPEWNTEIGHVTFNIGDNNELDPQDLFVKEKYRNQGVARTMYDFVKTHGYKIQRSWDQTDAGAAFWEKNRGEERVWETEVDEDLSRRGFLQGAGAAAALGATGAVQAKINPSPKPVAQNPKVDLLMKWAKQFITNPAELAAFMAQCAHESDNFATMTEYGTPERFAKKYDIQYNPGKAKQLGNDRPGDGVKYRGRGYIQLTGKYNYQKAGEWVSKFINHPVDFVSNPDLVATPTAAALSSLWYWLTFVRPKTKSFGNTKQVTKNINPGLKGEKNREQKARDWQAALNVKPGKAVKVATR